MESAGISHILVYISGYNKFPLAKVQKKDPAQVKEQLVHRKSGQQKAVLTFEEYLEKIARPQLEAFIKMLNPEFVSKAGLTRDEIINKKRAYLFSREAYENYIKDFSNEDITRIIEELPQKSADSARKKVFGDWRLAGPLSPDSKSALEIIIGWLDGNKKIVKFLRAQDKLLQGKPVQVIPPERVGEFKLKLRTLLKRVLGIIQCAHYAPSVVQEQNDRLNQLVNTYLGSDFVPFTTGGASHIDFIVVRESVIPADSTEVKEIVYEIYSSAECEEKAKKLRATWIEKDYLTKPDPNEYIGNPDKQAYFNMYLDIQVSK